ncbi:MAG: phosphoglycerate kinase [Candidatus Pacebacteria bacterium]|nr:phosphoglycerate kinase [Candidatus Paceibacterota bacterium]
MKSKKVLLRVDLNVPVSHGVVDDDFRIKKTLPTIEKLRKEGAKVILLSHVGEKDGTLRPIYSYLRNYFPVKFVEDVYKAKDIVGSMEETEVVLFENLRKWEGEKDNNPEFAKHLASFGDLYINEAFSASHREHSSIVGIPKHLPSSLGDLFKKEVEELSKVFDPQHPFVFVLGGVKFSTKIPLIEKFLDKADQIHIAGALMNDMYKAKGFPVGKSVVDDSFDPSEKILNSSNLFLPTDVVVEDSKGEVYIKKPEEVLPNEKIMDIGPESLEKIHNDIIKCEFILWNGPLGNYENGYSEGTNELAHRISESGKDSIIGGGDTLSVVSKLNILDKFTFVSTAGGAMLDFLANGTLPGIEALK